MSIADSAPSPRQWFLDPAPLRDSPAYARFWTSGVAGGIGTQLTAVAIGIHVYQLTGTTAAVAMVGALSLGPMIVVGVLGGTLVDAFDRRRVLIVASSISFVAPLGIALLAWFEVREVWPFYLFTTLSATVGTLVGASRFAIHPRLVPRHQLPAAASWSGLSAGLQTAVGPALAGLLIASVGFAWTYTIDLGLFLIGFWGILSLPPIPPSGGSRFGFPALIDGFRFLRSAGNLRTAIGIQLASFTFGRSYALLPAIGALLLGGGATTVGFLAASAAIGVIVGGLLSGRLTEIRRHGRAMAISTVAMAGGIAVFGIVVLVLSLVPHEARADRVNGGALVLLCTVLALIGAADNAAGIFRTTMMQSATPDEVRGRLQGSFTLVLTAGPRLGDVYAGFLAAGALLLLPPSIGGLWLPPLIGAVLIAGVVGLLYRTRPGFRAYDAEAPVP